VATFGCEVAICGDFNLHVNKTADQHTSYWRCSTLLQVVDVSTHREGNTLDLVITRRDCPPTNCTVQLPTFINQSWTRYLSFVVIISSCTKEQCHYAAVEETGHVCVHRVTAFLSSVYHGDGRTAADER